MSELYLQREQELIRLNQQLDAKSKEICRREPLPKVRVTSVPVKKINSDKKIEATPKIKDGPKYLNENSEKENIKKSKTPDPVLTPVCVIPDKIAKKNISSEGLIRFLKAKVTILQTELETSQKDNLKKNEDLQINNEIRKQIEQQRDDACGKNSNLQIKCTKLEDKNQEIELKLKDNEIELTDLRKDADSVKKELKSTTQANIILEKRLLKSQCDYETIKSRVIILEKGEKEFQERLREDRNFWEKQIKILKKQRLDLISGYKKQMMLLNNLKKQNLCLEQAKLIDFSEKEFTKILEWSSRDDKK